jgi:hypothetical protein
MINLILIIDTVDDIAELSEFQITTKENMTIGLSKRHNLTPKVGNKIRLRLHQLGNILIIRGVELNDNEIFNKTSDELNEQISKSKILSKIIYFE